MLKRGYDIDTPLIVFSNEPISSAFSLRSSFEGIAITGGLGTGKSTSSGCLFAHKFLEYRYGGLVLTAKPDECKMWLEYAKLKGRENDIIVIEPGGKHSFNLLQYLSTSNRPAGITITANIVQAIQTVINSSVEKKGGNNDDPFWQQAATMTLSYMIDLCMLAYNEISIDHLYNIITTAPKKGKTIPNEPKIDTYDFAFTKALKKITDQLKKLEAKFTKEERESYKKDEVAYGNRIIKEIPQSVIIKKIDNFFNETYKDLSDKTKSIIEFSVSGFLFMFLQEPFKSLFCNSISTFQPEDCYLKSKVIILNIPTKEYDKAGRDAQISFKYIWQKCMEKRNILDNDCPLFLWIDEAQNFLHEYDYEYQSTARSSRIATVYISQNLPNYYASMGGDSKSEYRVKSLFANLTTKIFHANTDIDTNKFASESIGDAYVEDVSNSTTLSGKFSSSTGSSYKRERIVPPENFLSLKCGGPKNNFQCEAYIIRQGEKFSNGTHFKKITFSQK